VRGGENVKLREISFRKPVKFLTLLLTAMLIATASAAVYYSLTIVPTVTISATKVSFVQGSDWPSGSLMGTNSTSVSLALKAYPNATLTYEQPLNISNTDTLAHSVRLRHVSITPASGSAGVSNFTFINFTLIQPNGTTVSSFDYTTSGNIWSTPSMNYLSLAGNTQWTVEIQTRAAAGATNGLTCSMVIAVDVQ
jgi:hypothetical protein